MPESLSDQMPEFHPVREGFTVAGLGALSAVPIAGGVAATLIGGALASLAARRNAELFELVAETVDDLSRRVEGWTPEAIASEPRFLAAAERVVRAAQGEADDQHRKRLIGALRHAGPWSQHEPYTTERMTDLLTRLGPIHIFVLRFFADPAAWLITHGGEAWSNGTETHNGGSLIAVFGKYVFPDNLVPPGEIARVVEELQRESLMGATRDGLLSSHITGGGLLEPRLTEFGVSFLAFAEGELAP